MKKIVRLTENDLTRIVKKVIKEQEDEKYYADIHYGHAVDLDSWTAHLDDVDDWKGEYDEIDTFDDLESFEASQYRRDYKDPYAGITQAHFDEPIKSLRGGGPVRILKRRRRD